jgi:hypothetical protein
MSFDDSVPHRKVLNDILGSLHELTTLSLLMLRNYQSKSAVFNNVNQDLKVCDVVPIG